jgi:hypothetical protein
MVPQRLSHGNTVTTERIHGQTNGVILLRYPPALAHHCFYNVANGPTRRPRTRRNGNRNLRSSGHYGNQLFLGSCQTTLAISRPRIISIMCILRRRHRRRDARFVQPLFEKHVVITSVFVRLRLFGSSKDVMRLFSYFHFFTSLCLRINRRRRSGMLHCSLMDYRSTTAWIEICLLCVLHLRQYG